MHNHPNPAHRAACAVDLADVLVAVIPAAERGAAILGAVTVVTPVGKQGSRAAEVKLGCGGPRLALAYWQSSKAHIASPQTNSH